MEGIRCFQSFYFLLVRNLSSELSAFYLTPPGGRDEAQVRLVDQMDGPRCLAPSCPGQITGKHEPGVLVIGDPNPRYKRHYRTLRIPQSVLQRVHNKLATT